MKSNRLLVRIVSVLHLALIFPSKAPILETENDVSNFSHNWRQHENAFRVNRWMESHESLAVQADELAQLVNKVRFLLKMSVFNYIIFFEWS